MDIDQYKFNSLTFYKYILESNLIYYLKIYTLYNFKNHKIKNKKY